METNLVLLNLSRAKYKPYYNVIKHITSADTKPGEPISNIH